MSFDLEVFRETMLNLVVDSLKNQITEQGQSDAYQAYHIVCSANAIIKLFPNSGVPLLSYRQILIDNNIN